MKDKITLCGDNCTYCPRYNAKTEEELNGVAELWHRVGMRDEIVSADEMRCSGCTPHNVCAYGLYDCTKEHSVEKCNKCIEYPCGKIKDMLNRVKQCKETWQAKCSESEYALFEKAFFQKEENLRK
jgi:hypothetical protein